MNYTEFLAAEVRAQAARKKISGRALAAPIEEAVGLSRNTVARMLSGERPWDVNSLSVAAKVLDLSVADLIASTEEAMADNRCNLPSGAVSASSQVTGLQRVLA